MRDAGAQVRPDHATARRSEGDAPSRCLGNGRKRSISAAPLQNTRQTDLVGSLGLKSDRLLGAAIDLLQATPEGADTATPATALAPAVSGTPVRVRHYAANDSVFINDDYLIKGVAGAIFWKLLRDYVQAGRTEFTNRELRLDPSIRLPDVADNLEARLLLLQRRLQENTPPMRIEKTGRGRFRLCVACPVLLEEQPG